MRAPSKPEEFFCVMIAPSSSPSVQACRHRGINPFDYLKDVLTQIPHHTNKTVAQLTPDTGSKTGSLT